MVHRVCYEIATGRIIEEQSGGETEAHLQTLIDNAIGAGWNEKDIACEYMDDTQYAEALTKDPGRTAEKNEVIDQLAFIDQTRKDLETLIVLQDKDMSKLGIADILNRLEKIEILIGVRKL